MSDPSVPTRPLRDLAAALGLPAPERDPHVTGITADSRAVAPGSVFVAVPGTEEDGHAFIGEAVGRGAVAVVAERDGDVDVPVLRVPDARRALAELAAAWHGRPGDDLTLVGITGSLGKTSILTMLEAILAEAGVRAGAIGSEIVGIRVRGRLALETRHTTPDPMTLHEGFRRVRDEGAGVACMEVTSHALDQERVYGLTFALGVFSNLVPLEHQDYHGTFEEYVRVKTRFCDQLAPGAPLLFGADNERLRAALAGRPHRLIGCGFGDGLDVRIAGLGMSAAGSAYRLEIRAPLPRLDGPSLEPFGLPLTLRLLGRPHVLNSAFAAAAALALGVGAPAIQRALAAFPPPERRMQLRDVGGLRVLDDTAGHPDSLAAVFDVVDHLPHRGLHVVAAVRGQRGAPINGRLAHALGRACADRPFDTLTVTDSEDVADDLNAVEPEERAAFLDGLRRHGARFEHAERLTDAVAAVAERATPEDLVVLIGAQGMIPGADLLHDRLRAG